MRAFTTVAIISEYNPFHLGHAYLFTKAREEYPNCAIVSVMSGNTVQRGDFAVYDRYTRAEAAIACGCELALEMPYPYSSSASEQFARAGVRIAMEAGADVIMFGSGSEDPNSLFDAVKILKTEEFRSRLVTLSKENPDRSFLSLREELYRSTTGKELPRDGNSSLGIEYIITAENIGKEIGKTVKCHPIKRMGSYTATACREELRASNKSSSLPTDIPKEAATVFNGKKISGGIDAIPALILGTLRFTAFNGNFSASKNGIKEAILRAAENAKDMEEFYSALPTATYTRARLRRTLMDMLLLPDCTDTDALKNTPPVYTVLLGANERGFQILSEMRKTSSLTVITKPSDTAKLGDEGKKAYEIAERVEKLYSLTFTEAVSPSELIPRFKVKRQ